jgi:hypothetical protein
VGRHEVARAIAVALSASLVAGCAVSSQSFYRSPYSVSNLELCKTIRASEVKSNPTFTRDVVRELTARGLTPASCNEIIQAQRLAIAAGIAAGAAIYAAAQNAPAAAGSNTYVARDYAWDWDQFYDEHRNLVWACRGIESGQLAESHRCNGRYRSDWRWPGK